MKKIITPEMSDPNDGSDNFTYSTEIEGVAELNKKIDQDVNSLLTLTEASLEQLAQSKPALTFVFKTYYSFSIKGMYFRRTTIKLHNFAPLIPFGALFQMIWKNGFFSPRHSLNYDISERE